MRIGVISNPRSQRNRSEMARMRELMDENNIADSVAAPATRAILKRS